MAVLPSSMRSFLLHLRQTSGQGRDQCRVPQIHNVSQRTWTGVSSFFSLLVCGADPEWLIRSFLPDSLVRFRTVASALGTSYLSTSLHSPALMLLPGSQITFVVPIALACFHLLSVSLPLHLCRVELKPQRHQCPSF
jgi:hypothetical protein